MALLADCEHNQDKQAHKILVALLKQPSFVPEANDFDSFVQICMLKRTNLLLKTFLQSFQMQFVFSSYSYERQRRIVRMLLGISPDGADNLFSVFEPGVTLKAPYQLLTLIELLVNSAIIMQAENVAKDLLTTLTPEKIVLATHIDGSLSE